MGLYEGAMLSKFNHKVSFGVWFTRLSVTINSKQHNHFKRKKKYDAFIWKQRNITFLLPEELFCVAPQISYATMTVPVLSAGAISASPNFPEVPAAGSVVVLALPGLISVLSVPTSLTQNCKTHTNTHISGSNGRNVTRRVFYKLLSLAEKQETRSDLAILK